MLNKKKVVAITESTEYVHIEDIVIPEDFKNTECSYNKIRWAKEYYQRNGHMDKSISIIAFTNENGKSNELLLVDEYSRYLAAKEHLNLDYVPVKYIDINDYCMTRNI